MIRPEGMTDQDYINYLELELERTSDAEKNLIELSFKHKLMSQLLHTIYKLADEGTEI